MNGFLKNDGIEITDLFADLSSGAILLRFLSLVSNTELPPASRGRLKVHKLENCSKALTFLKGGWARRLHNGPALTCDTHAQHKHTYRHTPTSAL